MYDLVMWAYNQVQTNQFLVAAMFAAAMYLVRSIPYTIWRHIHRNITLEFTTEVQDQIYSSILQYVDRYRINMFSRNYGLRAVHRNEEDDEDITHGSYVGKNLKISIGYGISVMIYKRTIIVINRIPNKDAAIWENKESCSFVFYTRNKTILQNFLREVNNFHNTKSGIQICKQESNYWREIGRINKRSMDSIFIDNEKKNQLINKIQWFLDNESWYKERGINYKLGILLSGPPGSGKSSIIRAIASNFGFDIHYLELIGTADLTKLLMQSSNKLVVIEDIDCVKYTHSRDNDDLDGSDFAFLLPEDAAHLANKKANQGKQSMPPNMDSNAQLSNLLNVLDGALTPNRLIFIATTNHYEKLDAALVRPGRIDLDLEIGAMSEEVFTDMISYFYKKDRDYVSGLLQKYQYEEKVGAVIMSKYFENLDSVEDLLADLFQPK